MLLELYALYKQKPPLAMSAAKRPGMMDFINRAKYDAWERYRGYSSEAAMERYLKWPTPAGSLIFQRMFLRHAPCGMGGRSP